MARCKECLHYEVCAKEGRLVQVDEHTWDEYNKLDDVEQFCTNYFTADVVPKSELEISQHLLKDAWKRIEELDELCGELQRKYDLAVAEREANVKGFAEELEKANDEIERLKYNLKAVLEEIPETKREFASEIFAEIEYLIWQYDTRPANELTEKIAELKKKYTEGEG